MYISDRRPSFNYKLLIVGIILAFAASTATIVVLNHWSGRSERVDSDQSQDPDQPSNLPTTAEACRQADRIWLKDSCHANLLVAAGNCPQNQAIAETDSNTYFCQVCPIGRSPNTGQTTCQAKAIDSLGYIIFSDLEFNQLFTQSQLDNLTTATDPPTITGDDTSDQRIRRLAEAKGYRRQPAPSDSATLIQVAGTDQYLQPLAHQAWLNLKAAAAEVDFNLVFISGYRSHQLQRQIFLGLTAAPYSDQAVNQTLECCSIPGYSKQHTGYAMDISQAGFAFTDFTNSAAYQWLTANNYQQAKIHGWLPSYPPNAPNQGPAAEPWEFVWVGAEALKQ